MQMVVGVFFLWQIYGGVNISVYAGYMIHTHNTHTAMLVPTHFIYMYIILYIIYQGRFLLGERQCLLSSKWDEKIIDITKIKQRKYV